MHYREALARDVGDIVAIHVTGGQQAYADILPSAYLEDTMPTEKRDLWRSRLENGLDQSKLSVTVAEEADDVAGFACFLFDQETDFGTYLHNIYVAKRYQRRGVASGLLNSGIGSFQPSRLEHPVHLLVFDKNTPARAFYERLGGEMIEETVRSRAGSGPIALCRYQWPSANTLRDNSLRLALGARA